MQVGPPDPLTPISLAGYVWTSQPAAANAAAVTGFPSARITTPGRTARTLQPSVRNSSSGTSISRMPSSPEQFPQPDGEERQIDDGKIVGHRRDDAEQVDQLSRALPVRDVEDTHVATDDLGESGGTGRIRAKRPADAEQVRPQPERITAFDRPGRLDPAERRDARCDGPALEHRRLFGAVGFPGTQRDGAAVRDQQRVEGVDEIRVVRLLVKDVDRRAEARQDVHEGRVLATRDLQVAGVQEAVRGVIERPPECRAGRLHEHVPKRGGHALGAVRPSL